MLDKIPIELLPTICKYIDNPKDIRNIALINKISYIHIKYYFIDKEKWIILSIKNNESFIKNVVEKGFRFIYFNNKIQYIYNITGTEDYKQIITQYGVIQSYNSVVPKRYNYIKLLLNAPYNLKIKRLKINF